MKRVWYILILLIVAKENYMAANASKPVNYLAVAAPGLWKTDDLGGYIVVTAKNWSKYYPSPPQGSDFSASIYVVASMGTRPNPGYRIRIVKIAQEGEHVEVSLEQLTPDPKGMYPQMLVNPIAVAEVKRKDLQPYPVLNFAFVNQSGQSIAEVKVEF